MWKRDLYVAIFLLLLSIMVFLQTLSYPYESAYFPRIIILLLALMGCALLGKTLRARQKERGTGGQEKQEEEESLPLGKQSVPRKVILMIVCSMIYLIILSSVGFFVTTLAYLPVMGWMLGIRKPKTIALSTFFVVFFIYLIFEAFLKVPLPRGVLF